MLLPVICYRCDVCQRLYTENVDKCICERSVFVEGQQVGPFIVIGPSEDSKYLKVRCILCNCVKNVNYTNVRRQASCGCKPRHAHILSVNTEKVTYTCKRCGITQTCVPPIVFYCCEQTGDALDDEQTD